MANRRSTARDLAQIAIFAALIAALGLPGTITVGSTGVPITLQSLGIMLTGGILGARKGFLAVAVFLLLTSAGLPLLAGGRGGLGIWTGASAGYLVGWLVGVVVIGLLTARILPRYPLWQGILVNFVGGVLVVYLFGVAWGGVRTGFAAALTGSFAVPARGHPQVGRRRAGHQAGAPVDPRPDRGRLLGQPTGSAGAEGVELTNGAAPALRLGGAGDRPALSVDGQTWSYREFATLVRAHIQLAEATAPGPLIATGLPVAAALASVFAAAAAGVPVVIGNPARRRRTLRWRLATRRRKPCWWW